MSIRADAGCYRWGGRAAIGCLSVLGFGLSGCAASMATLDTGEALKPEAVAPEYTMAVNLPVSQVWELATEAYDIYQDVLEEGEEFQPTEEQTRTLMKSILFAALYPPSVPNTFGFRVGLAPRFNLGLRYNDGFAVNAKYQLLDLSTRKLALTAEFQHQSSAANELLNLFGSDGFEANSGFVQLIYSRNFRDIFKPYLAVKGRYTRYHVSEFVTEIEDLLEQYTDLDLATELDGEVWAYGGAIGFLLGYQYVYGSVELTAMNLRWDTTLVGEPTRISGLVLSPAVGITVIIPPHDEWPDWARPSRN